MSESNAMQVSLASHPSPVLQYKMREGIPTVTAINDAFEIAFGTVEAAPVIDVFEQFDTVESPSQKPLETQLRAGKPVEFVMRSAEDTYVAHVLAPDTDGGTILFTERDSAETFTESVEVAQVASAISHDLRNPLDVAGAHLEAARETGASEHFDAVAAAHDRMERIVQEVLTLAQGEVVLNRQPEVSIRDVAKRAWQTVETETWTLTVDESLPTVEADADRLQRLFENLFRNSVEHASTGCCQTDGNSIEHAANGQRVWVGTLAGETAGVFIADDGPGIPPGEQANIFTPGYTVDEGGTGLGLAIVDRIAELHDWSVSVTESDRGGARIELRFNTRE
ncbi:HAMP domain-containing sensor histidine kinase [Halorubrum sp. BV1]|uniref:sensor histidine kinase n=1 Tax=Halorubrum sp. BV1 TaxID=1498500 RepID=UPI000678A70A|nr:HAMP domain-containing sensor histidine kinase [Halorubrum sp. BV1]